MKPTPDFLILLNQFNETLKSCRNVYIEGGQTVIDHYPHLLQLPADRFLDRMDDLHRGLLIKLFVEVAGVDSLWTETEEQMAGVLFFHLWQRRIGKTGIRESLRHVSSQSRQVKWESLVRPFADMPPLQDRIPALETVIIRAGNLIAKADGCATSLELDSLRGIQQEILGFLHRNGNGPTDRAAQSAASDPGPLELQSADAALAFPESLRIEATGESSSRGSHSGEKTRPHLKKSLARLDELIGLKSVKQEVNTLVNFIKLQKHRGEMGLPETDISLHMVFRGNPGTGKTTVARILGEIYAAMGILENGHLVETDRAGLVAEYAGQTAVKTGKLIDQALGGLLFIDEAYSLVSPDREDPYGHEAVQILLKRMEDDRHRLVVILAGYPAKMDRLLRSNPGLSSRFTHHIGFEDYSPVELARIFEKMCRENQYQLTGLTRARLMAGFGWMHQQRDEHFGNGRFVRNLFEHSIRRLANRIVDSTQLSRRLLTRFEPADVEFTEVPAAVTDLRRLAETRYGTRCPECQNDIQAGVDLLGRKVECKKCHHRFRIGWCEPIGG